jgi:hypothetical protein
MGPWEDPGLEKIVSSQNIYFVAVLAILLLVLATVFVVYSRRARKTSHGTWNDLLKRLKLLDRDNIAKIALDVIQEPGGREGEETEVELDPEEIWPLIGGLEGLEVLEHNCSVLVDMAFYVQKWHPEAVVLAEQLRLNAREITWHVERLKGARNTGNLRSAFPDYAQRAVATYYLMTQSLLALYEQSKLPEFADLQRAI